MTPQKKKTKKNRKKPSGRVGTAVSYKVYSKQTCTGFMNIKQYV
jgi:hypothetical protein